MSIKRIVALLLAVALLVPGFTTAFANPNNPNISGVDPDARGSITINRIAGTNETNHDVMPPVAPAHPVANVPIRVQQIRIATGAVVTTENLASATWVAANVEFIGSPRTGLTDANGQVTFADLAQGTWLVQELASLEVGGVTYLNPILETYRFYDFVVGIPRWIADAGHVNGGEWLYDIEAWPKSGIPGSEGARKEAIYYSDSIATWELGHRIPNAVASIPYFSALDILPSSLTFIPNSVVGRFTRLADASNDWNEVTGQLTSDHFTVTTGVVATGEFAGQSYVLIELTDAGRAFLAANGLLGSGDVMFRLDTAISGSGRIYNNATWRLGTPPNIGGECKVDDPTCVDVLPVPIDTFNLEVLKLNVAQQELAGAEFRVYRTLTEVELAALPTRPAGAEEITVGGDTFYVVPLRTAAGAAIEATTGANGRTRFNNTSMSSYGGADLILREVKAPTGYRIIQEWMPITVNTDTSRVVDSVHLTEVTVFNEPVGSGWELPQTGGVGTIILTVVGLALVGGALVLFVGSKKEEEDVA